MPYYLSPLVKVGGLRGGRSPIAHDEGANWILLDRDRALVWTPENYRHSQLAKLSEHKADRPPWKARRRLLDGLFGRSHGPDITFQQSLVRCLLRPLGQWKSLRPSKERQRFEIFLGPDLFWSAPAFVGPNSKIFLDNFNRANANLNGSNSSDGQFTWLEVDGTGWTGANNRVELPASSGYCTARANADLDTTNHYVQALMANYNSTGGDVSPGLIVRWTGPTNGYVFECGTSGSTRRRIYRYDNDATIVSDAVTTSSGTLYLSADGSTLTGKVNGTVVLGPSTNTQFTGQLRCGIQGYTPSTNTSLGFDNFECGDIVSFVWQQLSQTERQHPEKTGVVPY